MQELRDTDYWARVQSEPLAVSEVLAFLDQSGCGAVNVFIGKTRRFTKGRETVHLEYDLYPEMAVAEMSRIATEALTRWPVERVALIHRAETVAVGEASVIVGASAPHRSEAFEACRFLIDTLKQRAPIWKKELFSDGSKQWVEGG